MIARGEPAIMVSHWPGMYYNGQETGFEILRRVVGRLDEMYDNLIWMKLSEIARYAAARALTRIEQPLPGALALKAPFACPQFTLKLAPTAEANAAATTVRIAAGGNTTLLEPAAGPRRLKPGTFFRHDRELTLCFDLPRGESRIVLE